MKPSNRIFSILLLCAVLAGSTYLPVSAGVSRGWSTDARVPGYLDDTFTPILLADRNRTVHAFASQWVDNSDRKRAIVYRQWTLKGGWTRPVDIILAPDGDVLVLGVFMDASDRMHVIFENAGSNYPALYYSSAPAENADSALAWSSPLMVGSPLALQSAAITGDDQGHLVIIYSGNADGNGVYSVESSDGGANWTKATRVYLTYDAELIPYSLQLAIGPDLEVRAAWNVVTGLGVDKLLYFATHDREKSGWGVPVQLDEQIELQDYFGPSFPSLVDNGKAIVLMYNSGNPFSDHPVKPGRPVQQMLLSIDGGDTWNGPSVPFPFHVGRSGEHALVLDGAGTPHTLFVQRIESADEQGNYSAIGGVWHSAFRVGAWTNPERFATTYTPHDLHAVVSQGNVLLVTWREDPGAGKHGIWFSFTVLDVPELAVVPLSTAPVNTPIPPTSVEAAVVETSTPLPSELLDGSPPSTWQTNPALPLIVGVVPVALIVLGAVAAFRILNERRM